MKFLPWKFSSLFFTSSLRVFTLLRSIRRFSARKGGQIIAESEEEIVKIVSFVVVKRLDLDPLTDVK